MNLLEVTEMAAIACYKWIGRGNEKGADAAATDSLRRSLNRLPIFGRIVIGEGERDDAPMLYIGEKLGSLWNNDSNDIQNIEKENFLPVIEKQAAIDIAVDPLEGTTICANNAYGSISVMAISERGGLLHAPDVYMDKIAIGCNLPKNLVDLDATPEENINALAKAKKCDICDLCVVILNRPRHMELIKKIHSTGARVKLISDGDISAILEICSEKHGVDMYYGIGGAPEGVLAAAAVVSIGGQMQGRLIFENEIQAIRAKEMSIIDIGKKYSANEMACGEKIQFYATGITTGALLKGIRYVNDKRVITNSLIINKEKKMIEYVFRERFAIQ